MMLPLHHDQDLERLNAKLNESPRMCGYYLLRVVSTAGLADLYSDATLDLVFESLDDKLWPPPEARPTDQTWLDYELSQLRAQEIMIPALIGGSSVGHTRDTMTLHEAGLRWQEFRAHFADSARYFAGSGLGDREYVYQVSVAVVDSKRAGVLGVIESD